MLMFSEEDTMPVQNVDMRVEGQKLIVEVDLTQDLGLSSSGKSRLVAVAGCYQVPGRGDLRATVTVFRPLSHAAMGTKVER